MHLFEKAFRSARKTVLPVEVVRRAVSEWQRTRVLNDAATGYASSRPSAFNVMMGNWDYIQSLREQHKDVSEYEFRQSIGATIGLAYSLLSYQANKRIYDINPTLFQGLCDAEFPANAPVECLYAPDDHAPILCMQTGIYKWVIVSLDAGMEPVTQTVCRFLHIKAIGTEKGNLGCDSLLTVRLIPGLTVQDAFNLQKEGAKLTNMPSDQCQIGENPAISRHINGILATLAYIKADRDVVAQVHPGKKKFKGWSLRALAQSSDYVPEQFNVGDGYAKVIEHYEEGVEGGGEGNTGKAVRPHIRRPHAHLYHTKNGPVIHFLPPISVKGADLSRFDPEKPMKILVK
jgi:hypothetical protein